MVPEAPGDLPAEPAAAARAPAGPYPHLWHITVKTRSREQVLTEVTERLAETRSRIRPIELARLIMPAPEDLFWWKVALGCGHATEAFTLDRNAFPDQRQNHDPVTRTYLNPGEMYCDDESHHRCPRPYREITRWVSYTDRVLDPHPVAPPDSAGADVAELLRREGPRTARLWRVHLACGHTLDSVPTPAGWTPEQGSRRISSERSAEMLAACHRHWAMHPHPSPGEQAERAHLRRMIALCWPTPEPERACRTCAYAHQIEGYQRIGWLVPRPATPPGPAETERQLLEQRLARVQETAAQPRRELDWLT